MHVDVLRPSIPYIVQKDFQTYHTPDRAAGRIDNLPGYFSVFLPSDGHMPQLVVGECTRVRKLVVKIPTASVQLPDRIAR
jgi:beta-galactosidase beta subunit